MLSSTKTAVTAILQADPSLKEATIATALSVLEDNPPAQMTVAETDRVLSRKEVAEILQCSPHTVSTYGRRGLIRRILGGVGAERATGYSERSVMALVKGERAVA